MESERSAPRGKTPKIVLRVSDPQKFREGYLLDLAAGGVFVKSEKLLASGATVDVELHPPGWDAPLPLHGRVVRRVEPGGANPAGMLVGFEELAPESQVRLAELIAAFSGGGNGTAREGTPGPARALPPTTPGPARALAPSTPGPARAVSSRSLAEAPWPIPAASPAEGRPVPPAGGREDLVREAAELRGRLAAAEATVGTLKAELAAHEEDEAGTRALAERLALQKNKLERLRKKEAEEAATELSRLRGELKGHVEARAALEARGAEAAARAEVEGRGRAEAEARARELGAKLEAEAAAKREAEGRAEEHAARADELERRLAGAEEATRASLDRATQLDAKVERLDRALAAEREELAEARERIGALEAELAAAGVARDEAEARGANLEGRLAAAEQAHAAAEERGAELETRLVEAQEAHAAERDRLLAEIAAATSLAEETEEAKGIVEGKLLAVEAELGQSRATSADLEARLAAAEEKLGRLRDKERDLRRLLEVVSAKAAEEVDGEDDDGGFDVTDEEEAPSAAAARAEATAPEREAAPAKVERASETSEAPAKAADPASLEETRVGGRDPAIDVGGVVIAADLLAEAGVTEAEVPVDLELDEEGPKGGLSFSEFEYRLGKGGRVRRTEAFRRYKPTEPSEIRLAGLLVQADGLEALRELAGGKLAGDRLPRLLFDLYKRGLLELR